MKNYLIALIIVANTTQTAFAQVFSTTEKNETDKYTYTQVWIKGTIGYANTFIGTSNLHGLSQGSGFVIDYFKTPQLAFRTGIEIDYQSTSNSISEKSSNTATTIDYTFSYTTIQIPLGLAYHDLKKGTGFILGAALTPCLGMAGNLTIKKNNQTIVDRQAYNLDPTYQYQSAFNRFNLLLNISAQYQLNPKVAVGIDASLAIYNLSNLGNSFANPINTHQVRVAILCNLKKF